MASHCRIRFRRGTRAVPVLSKPLVAYVEGLLAMTPYLQATDVRAAGLADTQFRTCYELFQSIS